MEIVSSVPSLLVGWVVLEGIQNWEPNDWLKDWVQAESKKAMSMDGLNESEQRRLAVRAMLREGGFKPSGRSKPAQEYLMRCLREGEGLPSIFPAVDILNATSVRTGLPISLLQKDLFPGGRLEIRIGKPSETFVFNSAGQELSLENLIVICGGSDGQTPLGSPVKDSMAGKITKDHLDAVSILYGPKSNVSMGEMLRIAQEFAENLVIGCSPKHISFGCL